MTFMWADRDDTEDELALWQHVLDMANNLFEQLPPSVQREIDAGASRCELAKMAGPLATLSTDTRTRLGAILTDITGQVSQPEDAGPKLRLVDPEDG